jgi:hypothetical protein
MTAAPAGTAENPSPEVASVCDVFRDLPAAGGKTVVAIGKLSFRQSGRTLSEGRCVVSPGEKVYSAVLEVAFDSKTAPRPDGPLSIPSANVYKKLGQVKRTTDLGRVRFGSPDYDRWAFIYGRVENAAEPQSAAGNNPSAPGSTALAKTAPSGAASGAIPVRRARIVCSSEAFIVFVAEP